MPMPQSRRRDGEKACILAFEPIASRNVQRLATASRDADAPMAADTRRHPKRCRQMAAASESVAVKWRWSRGRPPPAAPSPPQASCHPCPCCSRRRSFGTWRRCWRHTPLSESSPWQRPAVEAGGWQCERRGARHAFHGPVKSSPTNSSQIIRVESSGFARAGGGAASVCSHRWRYGHP
jgi:hypothetical protein